MGRVSRRPNFHPKLRRNRLGRAQFPYKSGAEKLCDRPTLRRSPAAPSTTARSAPASGSASSPQTTRSPKSPPQPDPQSRGSPLRELQYRDDRTTLGPIVAVNRALFRGDAAADSPVKPEAL